MNEPELFAGGTTPHYAIPYPSASDPVAAGAANMQAIAQQTEFALGFIAAQTLAADAAQINFTSIPATYTDLFAVFTVRSNNSAVSLAGVRLNDDATGSYDYTTSGGGQAGQTWFPTGNLWYIFDGRDPASAWTTLLLEVFGYTLSGKMKPLGGHGRGGWGTSAQPASPAAGGLWRNGAVLNKISLIMTVGGGSFKAGSTAALYGRL